MSTSLPEARLDLLPNLGRMDNFVSRLFQRQRGHLRHQLLIEFLFLMVLIAFVGFMLWTEGVVDSILAIDTIYLCRAAVVIFGIGLIFTLKAVIILDRDRNDFATNAIVPWTPLGRFSQAVEKVKGPTSRGMIAGSLQVDYMLYINPIVILGNLLVTVGILGTLVGFIIGLSGVTKDAVSDVSSIGPMIAAILQGTGMAFYKSAIGTLLGGIVLDVYFKYLKIQVLRFMVAIVRAMEVTAADDTKEA